MTELDMTELATPTLMRGARGAYASAIRAELLAIGVDDLPRNGVFVMASLDGGVDRRNGLPEELGVTKQAVSQVTDILVGRGYLQREAVPGDRRRVALELTGRGHEVVEAVVRAVDEVDEQLRELITADQVDAMRTALIALAKIKTANHQNGTAKRRPPKLFRHFSPIFPVRNLADALAHYATLGFETHADDGGDQYGFANREGVGVHLTARPDLDPATNDTATYLYVLDADVLHEEWSRADIGGTTRPVRPTAYGMREGSHIDPDGNLIRFGSPTEE